MNVTRQELSTEIYCKTGISQKESLVLVSCFFNTLKMFLIKGKNIELRGFGVFKIMQRKARPVRNPKTGKKLIWKGRPVPIFKFSKDVKDGLKNKIWVDLDEKHLNE